MKKAISSAAPMALALLVVVLAGVAVLPFLAANGHLSPFLLPLAGHVAWVAIVYSLVVAVLGLILKTRMKLCGFLLVVAVGALTASLLFFTPRFRARLFVQTFAARVQKEVGVAQLRNWFESLRSQVVAGNRQGAPIPGSEMPKSIQDLFPGKVPRGNLDFADTEVHALTISWGGPFLRWGVKVLGDGVPEDYGVSPHSVTCGIATNVLVFMGE